MGSGLSGETVKSPGAGILALDCVTISGTCQAMHALIYPGRLVSSGHVGDNICVPYHVNVDTAPDHAAYTVPSIM